MRLIDSHAHLDFPQYKEDRAALLDEMSAQRVAVVNVGADLASSRNSVELARAHPHVLAACGVHPHDAKDYVPGVEAELEELLRGEAVAVGECGLDFYRDLSPREAQGRAFRAQLRLARRLDLPVILHERDAWAEFLEVLKEEGPVRGVVHAFSGDTATARQVLELGLYIGIGGPLTYPKNTRLREAVGAIPLDRLLVETDAPFLPPQPFRGKRNDPLKVRLVVAELAQLRRMSPEELAEITWDNACRLLNTRLEL
ncbi:MAG: TatD family hydrolase [Candidatus Bipolaricaulota bacterium]